MNKKEAREIANTNPSVEMWKCYECGMAPNEKLYCERCGRHRDDEHISEPRRFLVS